MPSFFISAPYIHLSPPPLPAVFPNLSAPYLPYTCLSMSSLSLPFIIVFLPCSSFISYCASSPRSLHHLPYPSSYTCFHTPHLPYAYLPMSSLSLPFIASFLPCSSFIVTVFQVRSAFITSPTLFPIPVFMHLIFPIVFLPFPVYTFLLYILFRDVLSFITFFSLFFQPSSPALPSFLLSYAISLHVFFIFPFFQLLHSLRFLPSFLI